MNTITCKRCGEKIEISAALQGQIEEQVIKAEHQKHEHELIKIRAEAAEEVKRQSDAAVQKAQKQITYELEVVHKEAKADLELAKKRLEAEIVATKKRAAAENELLIGALKNDAYIEKQDNEKLRQQLSILMKELGESKRQRDNAQLEMEKRLVQEEGKIRAQASQEADERQRLNLAAKEKTISDLQKALDDAQRKAAQGSQQLQGEIMELDFEQALSNAFRDDDLEPVAKGVRGGDIKQIVKNSRGTTCGVILWEIKRTKNWTDAWISKLKEDLRAEKANIPIIITEAMPKQISEDMGQVNGVWICKPKLAIILGTLLRKGLLDAGLQKALIDNRGTKADALYTYVTSHEFVQQIEAMVETFHHMNNQLLKERVVFEKIWSQRQKQNEQLLLGTASIIGSMQQYVGTATMPKVKGLELQELEAD